MWTIMVEQLHFRCCEGKQNMPELYNLLCVRLVRSHISIPNQHWYQYLDGLNCVNVEAAQNWLFVKCSVCAIDFMLNNQLISKYFWLCQGYFQSFWAVISLDLQSKAILGCFGFLVLFKIYFSHWLKCIHDRKKWQKF